VIGDLFASGTESLAYRGYLLAFVLATAACLMSAWRAWKIPYGDTRNALVAFFGTSGTWAAAYVGFLLAGSALAKNLFYQASLIVGFGTVWSWIWFCSAYSGRALHRYRVARWFAAVTFVTVTALKVTNPLHGLYYELLPTGGAFGLMVSHGTLYWVVMALSYALAATGYLMLFELFVKTDVRTGPLAVLTGLTALPAALNVIGHVSPSLLDVTHEPLGVAVFATGVLFAYTFQFGAVRVTGSLDEPSLVLGTDGRIRDCDRSPIEAIPGLGPEAIGKPLGEVLPELAETLSEGHSVWIRPSEANPQQSGSKHFRVVETALDGTRGSRLVILSDITERIRRENALQEAKEEAEKAARLKSSMLANMSHEIRTPLTSIIGFAEAITEDEEEAGRFAPLIEKSGKRLLSTLDGVLSLSKLEAGQMTLSEEEVDLSDQAEAVTEQFRHKAEEKGIGLEVKTNGAPAWAQADERGVQIVLQNLVSNAVKYTEEGNVQVRTYQENGSAVLEVEDTGIGIDSEMAEDLFEPFRQESEGLSRRFEGTGIGLTVTKKAVEQMNGSIEVKTRKNKGSQFRVRLDRASEAE
jgi:signal transduction histidine kinase